MAYDVHEEMMYIILYRCYILERETGLYSVHFYEGGVTRHGSSHETQCPLAAGEEVAVFAHGCRDRVLSEWEAAVGLPCCVVAPRLGVTACRVHHLGQPRGIVVSLVVPRADGGRHGKLLLTIGAPLRVSQIHGDVVDGECVGGVQMVEVVGSHEIVVAAGETPRGGKPETRHEEGETCQHAQFLHVMWGVERSYKDGQCSLRCMWL